MDDTWKGETADPSLAPTTPAPAGTPGTVDPRHLPGTLGPRTEPDGSQPRLPQQDGTPPPLPSPEGMQTGPAPGDLPPHRPGAPDTEGPTAVWVYAVHAGADTGPIGLGENRTGIRDNRAVAGVSGEYARVVEAAGLAAVVGSVPVRDFGPDALQHNMNDLDWLAAAAQAHNAVIESVAAGRTVVPVRLAVLCRDDDEVRAMLTDRRAEFAEALDLVEGRAEWGVKVFVHAASDVDADEPAAARAADELFRTLSPHAVATRHRPLTDSSLAGRGTPMLLNAAFLVEDDHADQFQTAVSEFDTNPHIDVDPTGPWLPYSFVGAIGDSR
ncbi:GvpL/GvpF family gas vesicle protein [Nocardia sp. 2]|uniref:GvpL/GvpF family gas vesicle protein n=1 Tax=Nocardia acididurans TaxID=2802282 RepID=A0ABS1M2M0_9NOCA|nr:GvpL/GvpF family gas vesicle protein [Nocardia acididurans]MBL1074310.1 GvpL/GvpF family gas vesicle protein [Nocardia acididurans]